MLAHIGTEWHILAHVGSQLSPPFIHYDNSFSGSIKFFRLKITLGPAMGESWLLLAETQKNTDIYKGLLPWEGFLAPATYLGVRW